MKKAFIFDIDGTLLDTINDIQTYVNQALKQLDYPFQYDREGTCRLVGDGVKMLMKRAIQSEDPLKLEAFSKVFLPLYQNGQNEHSLPFPDMKEVLIELKEKGISLYVVSNKPHELATRLIERIFPNLFQKVVGKMEGYAPKPDPYWILKIMEEAKLAPNEVIYVGDSLPDLFSAENAKIEAAICHWGYGDYQNPKLKQAKYQLYESKDLLKISL